MYVPDILRCTYIHVRCTANRFLKILTYFSVTIFMFELDFACFLGSNLQLRCSLQEILYSNDTQKSSSSVD